MDKLRSHLATILGAAGYQVLLSRALVLAKREAPALEGLSVKPDGALQIQNEISNAVSEEAASMLIVQFLRLLVTFLGAPLALRLADEAWPGLESSNGNL